MYRIFLLLCLILLGSVCYGFNIVYPKQNNVTINSNSTFFIGSSKEALKINGQNVPLHSSGAFAFVVNLPSCRNVFTIESANQKKVYVITKSLPKFSQCNSNFIHYPQKHNYITLKDNIPLRTTPVDGGINRIAHLQKDIVLSVDGEKNNFYRVILSADKYGWVMKSDAVVQSGKECYAEVKGYDYIDGDKYFTFVFHLTQKVPYEMVEGDNFLMRFYNIKKNDVYEMTFPVKEASGGKKLIGYSGEYQGNDFILKIRKPLKIKPEKPLKDITIVIDAGHGGCECGAVGCLGDKEKDITLSLAKYLETELENRGANVVMTRDADLFLGLRQRVDITNDTDAVVFLSLHGNALPDGCDPNKISGTEIYYYYPQNKALADVILNSMVQKLGTKNGGVKQASFAVVRNTNALSLLIETAYLINPDDNAKLVNPSFRKNCAKAIADGLEKYFSSL